MQAEDGRAVAEQTGKRVGQVTEQLCGLVQAVEGLHERIGELYERLEPLLAEEANKDEAEEPAAVLVPLAQEIREQADRVEGACLRVRGLTARLEL